MNTTLLKDLLDLGDAFEHAYPNPADQTKANFLAWAHTNETPTAALAEAPAFAYYSEDVPVLQTYLSHMVTNLARYFRFYVKKAFETAPLLSFDDFIALAYLAGKGHMTKTDLVETTINEKTSGMLVIKRLIDNGFVVQTDDEIDKRVRRLTITDEGMAMLRTIQPAMNGATALFKGDLTDSEQRQLSVLLARLDKFHGPIYKAHLTHKDQLPGELGR
ncbi:MAG: winged helix-turn-helix transcriptional regulator [Bacteroidetes bacterium]|nr:winged helix-turn-helix transcriptional regulator [Fibrella sp.]